VGKCSGRAFRNGDRRILSSIPSRGVGALGKIRERFSGNACIVIPAQGRCMGPLGCSFHQLVGKTDDLGRELFALCLYDGVIDGIGEACKDTAD